MSINSFYPDCGDKKYKILFNQNIKPTYICWSSLCIIGINYSNFIPNHMIPLFKNTSTDTEIYSKGMKRKSSDKLSNQRF